MTSERSLRPPATVIVSESTETFMASPGQATMAEGASCLVPQVLPQIPSSKPQQGTMADARTSRIGALKHRIAARARSIQEASCKGSWASSFAGSAAASATSASWSAGAATCSQKIEKKKKANPSCRDAQKRVFWHPVACCRRTGQMRTGLQSFTSFNLQRG